MASSVPGGELETIPADCDSPCFEEWNYYLESWNTQLMKAKLTVSVQDFFLSIRKLVSLINAFKLKSMSQRSKASFLHAYVKATINLKKSEKKSLVCSWLSFQIVSYNFNSSL